MGPGASQHRNVGGLSLGFQLSLLERISACPRGEGRPAGSTRHNLVEQLELDLIDNGHGDEDVSALHRWNQTKTKKRN